METTKNSASSAQLFIQEGIFDSEDKFRPEVADSHRNSYFSILQRQKVLPDASFDAILEELKTKGPQKLKHGDTLKELNKNELYYSKETLESLINYFENDVTCMI